MPKWLLPVLLTLAFGSLCAWPYLLWFAHPSLFDDDFLRVGSLRRLSLGQALFRPFNEHMAPLFETVSWLAWQAAGRRVLVLPLSFELSSYLALTLTALTLGAVAFRELRSLMAALICVATFLLSSVSAETVLWFSASSFEWSALAMLGAWYAAIRALESPSRLGRACWLVGSAFGSLAAPAFSAIGVLAGPVAGLRIFAGAHRNLSLPRRVAISLAPLGGTVLYLLICQQFRYGEILGSSVRANLDLPAAVSATLQAPSAILLPALFGRDSLARRVASPFFFAASGFLLVGGIVGWVRSGRRPLILVAFFLIFGGYFATYATRARPGDLSIFEVQRYHLFPQVGLSLLVAAIARASPGRFDRDLSSSLLMAVVVAGCLAIVQYPRMQAASELTFRFPGQGKALAATLKLESLCGETGVTLIQAINSLDATQPPWFPRPGTINPHLYLFARGPQVSRLADDQVRSTLLGGLSISEREALFGGLNLSPWHLFSGQIEDSARWVETRPVQSLKMAPIGKNQYRATGRGSLLEFEAGTGVGEAHTLNLPELQSQRDLEVWWAGEDGVWSSDRSFRVKPGLPRQGQALVVSLDRLPHWRPGFVRRIRLVFRDWGQVSAGAPRFGR